MLFDRSGQAIYLFAKETTSKPACYGACAVAWPPVLTGGEPEVDNAAPSDLLGTTQRMDGTRPLAGRHTERRARRLTG